MASSTVQSSVNGSVDTSASTAVTSVTKTGAKSPESPTMCSKVTSSCDVKDVNETSKMNGGAKPKICSSKGKGVKKKVSLSLDTVDESPPSSPRPPSKPRERRGAVDSMMRTGSKSSHCIVLFLTYTTGKSWSLALLCRGQVVNRSIVLFVTYHGIAVEPWTP